MFKVILITSLFLGSIMPHPHDFETAASDHPHGKVQIKVYRGPTEHDGHQHFAPWGYWVKQPADDHQHH